MQSKLFKFVADGDAYDVILGFVPDYMEFYIGTIRYVWHGEDGKMYKQLADGTLTSETAGGPTAYSTSGVQTTDPVKRTGGEGVTLPADLMSDSDIVRGIAFKVDRTEDIGDIGA